MSTNSPAGGGEEEKKEIVIIAHDVKEDLISRQIETHPDNVHLHTNISI